MAITDGYVIRQGGYYLIEDMSVPYAIASDGTVTLIGKGGSGGGGGQTDGLTNAQLRSQPVIATPLMQSSGNMSVQIQGGNSEVSLDSQPCSQITISNSSDADITVSQSGQGFTVIARSYFTFFGLNNANELAVYSPADVSISLRWEG